MSLLELYKALSSSGESGEKARALVEQEHWFAVNAEFDPKTGLALPQALSAFLTKVAHPATNETTRDRLWRITEHSRASVERLFRALNESPRREQALLPIHAVRELDANSFIKLSNRPGRTIREKLAGKPYLQAVRRFQSVNLPENRLLKAFTRRLAEALELRRDCLNQEAPLLPKIQSWLRSEEAQVIGNWDNLPPNNTLISHRDYRRVWDAWRWLQTLDDDIARDLLQIEARAKTMQLWKQCAKMWTDGRHLFAEIPLLFNHEKFEILPWSSTPPRFKESRQKTPRRFKLRECFEPACVDLTILRPRYATTATAAQSLPTAFLWQQWQNEDESVDIELFDSDAAWLYPQAITISSPDLFFSKADTSESFDRAARAFASKLRDVFRNDTLVWLAPDFLNDFELEVIRRNLNARFPAAEPLPRSVAAIFTQFDPINITGNGYAIVVVDDIGGKTCATKLIAKFDKDLNKRLPVTRGYYWERCPPIIFASIDQKKPVGNAYDITTVDAEGQWHDANRPVTPAFVDASFLKRDPRIGNFEFLINLMESPVAGGIHLHALQQRAGGIPLWRDQIPELSIWVMREINGIRFYKVLYLVSRGTTVKPIRGKPVPITIDGDFTLHAEKPSYEFPLFLGESSNDLGFSARLDSPAFPYRNDVICELNLAFEYGADEPYKLVFTPRDTSLPPVRTTWRRAEEIIVTNAPSPEYPTPMTWSDLRRVPKPDGNETTDLLEWVETAIARMDRDLYIYPRSRAIGVISNVWLTDKKGGHFTFATCDATAEFVFIHENSIVRELNCADFIVGMSISFELQERDGKYSGWKVAGPRYKETKRLKDFDEESAKNLAEKIHKGLYFPVIHVWREGRSIGDEKCPVEFAAAMKINIAYFAAILRECDLPLLVKKKIMFLLSCMHKDTTDECVQWITEQIEEDHIRDKRAVGFALGDVSMQWQKDVQSRLATHPTNDALSVFSHAIWRESGFSARFPISELQAILTVLSRRLARIISALATDLRDISIRRDWARATTETLELLLGLLRTRTSSNPEIRMLLQPHQKITKKLAKQVEHVTEIVAQSNVTIFSRVQINLQKPKGDLTPDLLYALRLYLTGDDGANAIHIASVSESDND
jgi:hypothetical protein